MKDLPVSERTVVLVPRNISAAGGRTVYDSNDRHLACRLRQLPAASEYAR